MNTENSQHQSSSHRSYDSINIESESHSELLHSKSNLFGLNFPKKIYEYSLQVFPQEDANTSNNKMIEENINLSQPSNLNNTSLHNELEPSELLLQHIEKELYEKYSSKIPVKIFDANSQRLFTPFFITEITFMVTVTSSYIRSEISQEIESEVPQNVYKINFKYEGMLQNQKIFMKKLWKNFMDISDDIILGDQNEENLILFPFDIYKDIDLFKHYHFVENSFYEMSGKHYLCVKPHLMVTYEPENLLLTIQQKIAEMMKLHNNTEIDKDIQQDIKS